MKNLIVSTILIMAMSGCITTGITIDTKQFMLDTAVAYVAYEMAVDHPEKIPEAIEVCDGIIAGTVADSVIKAGVSFMMDEYVSHPVLGSRMRMLSSYVNTGGNIDMGKVKKLAPAFKEGLLVRKNEL